MGYWGGVSVSYRGSSISYWSGDFSDNRGYRMDGYMSRFFVYDGVETVVVISGVVYGTFGSIGFQKGVASLYDIPAS